MPVPAVVRTERGGHGASYQYVEGDPTDKAVSKVLTECGGNIKLQRLAPGRYMLGESQKPLMIRVLRTVCQHRLDL